ncbi:DGQHR domain-containing protein [Perlucidibaca piscinae]|uniref:DGQHR domain-containing protein n=1 Tax=Perlucidibaca piscinae TaxID=392589 RepID=UPI000A02544F|nr:DGQHR domain-containing protein [Perlucidibaca piscinae]
MNDDLVDEMHFDRKLEVRCLKVTQPLGDFYIGVIDSKDLREITFSDVRRLEGERGFETYLGIQRPLSKDRVRKISEYVRTVDACFPTAVLLSVQERCAEFDEERSILTLHAYKAQVDDVYESINYEGIANVIDGQHRIAGLDGYAKGDFQINVSIFVDIDVSSEAYIFSTVNLAQTKVNNSLAYDLYDLATKRSPQKLCHEIAVVLEKEQDSPLHRRIKRLGTATPHSLPGSITQAAFVQSLMKYISSDPMRDRDAYMRGKVPALSEGNLNKLIFRQFLIKERDFDLTDIVWDYFSAVSKRWPVAWESSERGVMLSKTNGFFALMRLLGDIYSGLGLDKPSEGDFKRVFDNYQIIDDEFTTANYKPGSSGESALYRKLKTELNLG